MDAFTIQIANLIVGVEPLFQSTRDYCRAYLSEREPELTVTVTEARLVHEQALLDREAAEEGLRRRKFPDPFLERSAIQRAVADALLERGTLMFHGSTVAVDGRAYLFTAACGTGKSTHTRLWREVFGDRAVMVNDDKPFLQLRHDGVIAHGAPWSGKHGLETNIALPLAGICILRRGPENRIRPITPEQARDMLRHQAHSPEDKGLREKAVELADALGELIPLWEMDCTKDPQAAQVAHNAMSNE